MIAGSITYVMNYKAWFALKGYKIEAQSYVLEQRLWEVFPKRCLSFWPHFMKDSKGLKEFLERDMPVVVDTRMEKLGRFVTRIEWLSAWVKVDWRGKIWCISRDGRMWLFEPGRQNDNDAGKLVWKIPDQGNVPADVTIQAPMSGVFKSPLATEVIASFLENFRRFNWYDSATEISWERRAGMDLFTLRLAYAQQRFELLLQPGKYSGQDLGATIDDLFSKLINEGGNYVIDATYEGKILLRKLSNVP